MAVKTAIDTVAIVEKALKENPTLEKAIIVELPPRNDSVRLSELTEFCNFTLKSKAEQSKSHEQITIASLDTLYEYTCDQIFGRPSSDSYDGIHMKGKYGKKAYTNCILAAVESAGLRRPRRFNTNTSYTLPTSNTFESLSN